MGFNPISPFNGLYNGQQKNWPLNAAKDGLKSLTCEQTFKVTVKLILPDRIKIVQTCGLLYCQIRIRIRIGTPELCRNRESGSESESVQCEYFLPTTM